MKKLVHFLSYHNAVPITLGVLFLSSGFALAANDQVRELVADSVYQTEQKVVSIDNSYIANKDLTAYSPKVVISDVTEDEEFYYVHYTFETIALDDSVWQDVTYEKEMKVAKSGLGEYTDLGVYVTEQLKQLVDREVAYLKEVQSIERKQLSSKVVATAYSGLVGQFIDEKTEQLPGYTPRVSEPVTEDVDPVAVARADKSDVPKIKPRTNTSKSSNSNGSTQSSGSGPVITLLGANPARIKLNASYSDLGVVLTDKNGTTLDYTVKLSLNGEEVSRINIDTSTTSDWIVGYSAADKDGNTSFAERVVVVYDPNNPGGESTTGDTTPPTSGGGSSGNGGGGEVQEATSTATSTEEESQSAEEPNSTDTTDNATTTATSTSETTQTSTETNVATTTTATTTEPTPQTTATTTATSTPDTAEPEPQPEEVDTAATSTNATSTNSGE